MEKIHSELPSAAGKPAVYPFVDLTKSMPSILVLSEQTRIKTAILISFLVIVIHI